jgi:hypothetical protein
MNIFQRWIVEALVTQSWHLKHIEHKLDILLKHHEIKLPPELVKAGRDLHVKSEALQAALDAQKQKPQEQKP